MRGGFFPVIVALGLSLSVDISRAEAQRRAPAKNMWAAGISIGGSVPADPSLVGGLDVSGNLERYLTSRISVRGQLRGSAWDIVGRHFTGTVNPVFFDGNIVYNWEGGKWHPYLTGGIGLYHYRSHENLAPDSTDTNIGGNVGGGVEYFFTRRSTVIGEALYHGVGAFNTPLAIFNQGSAWTFTSGLKHYF